MTTDAKTRDALSNGATADQGADGRPTAEGSAQTLFSEADAADLHERWRTVQATFVDDPRAAVERADQLVEEVMHKLSDGFARERAELEKQWAGGSDVSTEDLRQVIRHYRSFFDRLLAL